MRKILFLTIGAMLCAPPIVAQAQAASSDAQTGSAAETPDPVVIGLSDPSAQPAIQDASADIVGISDSGAGHEATPSGAGQAAAAESGADPQDSHADVAGLGEPQMNVSEGQTDTPEAKNDASSSSTLLPGVRFTLKQEVASPMNKFDLTNNRTSFRVEYEKYFLENFYVHLDAIKTVFWDRDHRSKGRGVNHFDESTIREAYLQFSKGNTSVKLGNQIMIWGESDAGAITDVIAPRNLSELFFISLEESRISQFMLTVDQFTRVGDWSFFYVPDSQYNEYPEPGTAYYIDPFEGFAVTRGIDTKKSEYGLRWKKTFGNSDIGVMAARLIDNDYALRQYGIDSDGRLLLTREAQRFDMVGFTFNYVTGALLFSGEVAKKSPRAFIDPSTLQIVNKNAVDTSFRMEYSLGNSGTHSVSLEAVNKHIQDWDARISPTPRDTNSLVFGWTNSFFNENLTANLLSVYNDTYTSLQHSLFLTYKVNGRVSLSLDAFHLSVKDLRNELFRFRNGNNAIFRVLYQF